VSAQQGEKTTESLNATFGEDFDGKMGIVGVDDF
jgi:hypothetical protein